MCHFLRGCISCRVGICHVCGHVFPGKVTWVRLTLFWAHIVGEERVWTLVACDSR